MDLVEIIKETYPASKINDASFENGILKIVLDGEVRFYRQEDDKVFVYVPVELIKLEAHKLGKIITAVEIASKREQKINNILNGIKVS